MVLKLIQKNMNLSTPLMLAIVKKYEKEIIELLINSGADVNSKSDCLLTPLLYAIACKHKKENIELLIEKGADVNFKARDSFTPLHIAIFHSREIEIVELLINNGADVNSKAFDIITPLHYAIKYKSSIEMIDLLIKNDARPIIAYPVLFDQYNMKEDDNIIKNILKRPETIHVDLKTALIKNFTFENIVLLLKNGVNININGLSRLISRHIDYERLKGIKSFKKTKSFFFKGDLTKDEVELYSILHDNSIENRKLNYKNGIFEILKHEENEDIEYIVNKYDIDITTKTKNSEGILLLNSYYSLVNDRFIPNFQEDLIIPKYLSYNYALILIEYDENVVFYKINKGITLFTALQIISKCFKDYEEENYRTEKGNTAIHIQGAFNRNGNLKMKKSHTEEYINNNGWTPLFTSIFHNNLSGQKYFK